LLLLSGFFKKSHTKNAFFLPFKIFKNSNTKNTPFSKIGESGSKNDFFYLFKNSETKNFFCLFKK